MFPLLDALVHDGEVVIRQNVAEQIRGLAAVCAGLQSEKGYRILVEQLLSHLNKLVTDDEAVVRVRCCVCHIVIIVVDLLRIGRSAFVAQVRIAAGETLVGIAALIRKEDLGPRVLTIVLQLAHDDDQEDLRMTAVRGAMSPAV